MRTDVAIVLLQENPAVNPREWVEAAQGLGLLRGARLNAAGYLVRNERQRHEAAAQLKDRAPQVIFVAVGRDQMDAGLALLDELRALPPTTIVAVGGSFATFCSHQFTAHPTTGAVILGEWVEALVHLVLALKSDHPGTQIGGVWWKSAKGWVLTGRRLYAPDLAHWPEPAVEDFRGEELARHNGGAMPIIASRGFAFQTLFNPEPLLRHLQHSESYYWTRPPERVIEEAVHLKDKLRVSRFDFADDIFPWHPDWTRRFAALWMRHVSLPFSIRTVAEHVRADRLDMLRRARLERLQLCVDGGSEALRRRTADVNVTNAEIHRAIETCRAAEVETCLTILLGVPQETKESLTQSVALAREAKADFISAEIHRPWPESPQFADVERTLTGGVITRPQESTSTSPVRAISTVAREIEDINTMNRAARRDRRAEAALDGLFDIAEAKVRSPIEGALKIATFHAPTGSHDVVAVRVPAEVCWSIKLPKNPILDFGMLIKPALPGERSRLPISFSVKLRQRGSTFRLFQKIMVQALDPDSRTWHWFKIPVTHVKPGRVDIIFECLVYGGDGVFVPPGPDVWCGWAKVSVLPRERANLYEETTDHEFSTNDHNHMGIDLEAE